MQKRPEISVIVPCYNAERYLPLCLSSLAAQKKPELEMILIDDGSTDATGAILDRFAAGEPRAAVLHVRNEGVSAARNRGIDRAAGRYIAFLDSDDCLEEDALLLLWKEAERTGAQIVSAGHTLFDMRENRRIPVELPAVTQHPPEIVRKIIRMHRIYNNIWNKLYRAELFSDGPRLDEGVRIGEDALLNLQLYSRASRVAHLPQRTYVYRVHDDSAMASISGYSEAHQPMLRAMNRVLLSEGIKETVFRDFLLSCVWIDEKERGIFPAMRRFGRVVRPLALDGVREERLPEADRRLFRLTARGLFPAWYVLRRVREKLTGRREERGA